MDVVDLLRSRGVELEDFLAQRGGESARIVLNEVDRMVSTGGFYEK